MSLQIRIDPVDESVPPDLSKELGFGRLFTRRMFTWHYTAGRGWHDASIGPYRPLVLDPAIPANVRLEAAGYLSRAHAGYLEDVRRSLDAAGLADEFTYHGVVDRAGKLAFLQSIDLLSVPATYDEPKGVFLLEAMASGVPVVQPRRGAFTEIVEKTGGGILVAPDNVDALADGLHTLWNDRSLAETLGQRGFHGVREHYDVARSAHRLLAVYEQAIARGPTLRHASGL